MIYTHTLKYKHLTQMPSCCWPTCIQMVLFRHWTWVEQEQLAFDLWLVIEENNTPFYILPFKVVPKWDPIHWLKLYRFEEEQIINVLQWFWFSINVVYYSQITDFEQIIIQGLLADSDIAINFKREAIDKNTHTGGHFVLLSSYDSEKKMVTLCDPSRKAPNYWEIHIDSLYKAMSNVWDRRERGIVIIKKL